MLIVFNIFVKMVMLAKDLLFLNLMIYYG